MKGSVVVTEGQIKRGGTNPPPTTQKPDFSPPGQTREMRTYWWIGKVCRYGYVSDLVDGPHDTLKQAQRSYNVYYSYEEDWAVTKVTQRA